MGALGHALSLDALAYAVLTLTALSVGGYMVYLRRRREAHDAEALAEVQRANVPTPLTLHPAIDPDLCIGSLSCITACPEGDILGLVGGRAVLLDPQACIGHGACALECPVEAIRLVYGTRERGLDLPHLGDGFESSRPGVHVVGELGGMGLIKNALKQGLEVARALSTRLGGAAPGTDRVDVAIVGAGPAGIATAVGLKQARRSFRLLDQEPTLGGTIAHYPRQKLVMMEPVVLPGYGKLGKRQISKEELLEHLGQALAATGVSIEGGVRVVGIHGQDGDFTVETTRGQVRARKVVLAIGVRGSPRKLGARGEDQPKVAYRLVDPQQYDGARVLVVGGGDSAIEAAVQLATETEAEVTLVHRRDSLSRCREQNRRKLEELVDRKRVVTVLPAEVREIRSEDVTLEMKGKRVRLANDYVIVCTGGELPTEFLERAGVNVRRYYGDAPGATLDGSAEPKAPVGSARREVLRRRQRLHRWLWLVSLVTLGVLGAVGGDYYVLDKAARPGHPMHHLLRPSGKWGHGVGILATLLMLTNFAYSVRKRVRAFKGGAPIRTWLTVHQFSGLLAGAMVAFHAAFQSNNALASVTALALVLLVLTGIVGRFVYGWVPTRGAEYADVHARWERLKARVKPLMADVTDALAVSVFLSRATAAPPGGGMLSFLWRLPRERLANEEGLRRLRTLFPHEEHHVAFCDAFRRLWRLRLQVGFYDGLKRLFSVWRVLHVVLAVALVLLIVAHIAVTLYLGYRWVL